MALGPFNPASWERDERVHKNLMPPRPSWNAQGPHICASWRRALVRISDRLVLQYFPHGQIAGVGRQGFWAVCLRLPRSRWLFKQAVVTMHDPNTGVFAHPTWQMLADIRKAWHQAKHEGWDAIWDSMDRNIVAEDLKREQRAEKQIEENIERDLAQLNPSSRELGLARVCVPALN